MEKAEKSKQQIKKSYEINWKIREFFSESSLANFIREIDNQDKLILKDDDYLN